MHIIISLQTRNENEFVKLILSEDGASKKEMCSSLNLVSIIFAMSSISAYLLGPSDNWSEQLLFIKKRK